MEAASYQCPHCPKNYKKEVLLKKHIFQKHTPKEEQDRQLKQLCSRPLIKQDLDPTDPRERRVLQAKRHQTHAKDEHKYCLLECKTTNNDFNFKLRHASHESKTHVTFKRNAIACSCVDFRTQCVKAQVMCKHVLYVLITILRLQKQDLQGIENLQFKEDTLFHEFVARVQRL